MWPIVIASLVGGIPAIIFFLQSRSKSKRLGEERKKLAEARNKLGEFRERLVERDQTIVEIERERADDRERSRRVNRASARHIASFQSQLKTEIIAADQRGDGTSVLRLLNGRMERLRELSEATADRRDQNGELLGGDRDPTTTTTLAGD